MLILRNHAEITVTETVNSVVQSNATGKFANLTHQNKSTHN